MPYEEFNNCEDIVVQQCINAKELIADSKIKKERYIMKYKKTIQQIEPKDLIEQLENDLQKFVVHETNIVHQYQSFKPLKQFISEKDAFLHMDFSENYSLKCNQEIQALHFCDSRTQISLYTTVVYTKDAKVSHYTISSDLSHNAADIWAYLKPIIAALPATVDNVHFLSDRAVNTGIIWFFSEIANFMSFIRKL